MSRVVILSPEVNCKLELIIPTDAPAVVKFFGSGLKKKAMKLGLLIQAKPVL